MLPLCGLYGRKQHIQNGASWRVACACITFCATMIVRIEVIVLIIILVIVFSIIHVAEGQNDEIHNVDSKIHDTQ